MTTRTFVIFVASVALAACGRSGEPERAAAAEATVAEANTHQDDIGVVEIEEGMMRDLRITTSAVEARPGGERVVLLGELAVDQRAYAEVGTPVAARITRLLANAGNAVRNGQ